MGKKSKSGENKDSERLDKDKDSGKSGFNKLSSIDRLENLQEARSMKALGSLSRSMKKMMDDQNEILGRSSSLGSMVQSLENQQETWSKSLTGSLSSSMQRMADAQSEMLRKSSSIGFIVQSLQNQQEIWSNSVAGSLSSSMQRMVDAQSEILKNNALMSSLEQSLQNQQEVWNKSVANSLTRSLDRLESVYPKFLLKNFISFETINTNELELVLKSHKSILGDSYWGEISNFFRNLDHEKRDFSEDSLAKINTVLKDKLEERDKYIPSENESERSKDIIQSIISHFDLSTSLQVLVIIILLSRWYSDSKNNEVHNQRLEEMSNNVEVLVDEFVKSSKDLRSLASKNQKGNLLKTTKRAVIRKEPSSKSDSIATIEKGESIELLETGNRWNLVFTFDENGDLSKIGWIYKGNTIKVEK